MAGSASGRPGLRWRAASPYDMAAPREWWRWRRPGFIAVLAGWIVTEVGRQPFTVYGLLRTADSVSPIAAARRCGVACRLRGRLLHRLRRRLPVPAPSGRAIRRVSARPDRHRRACPQRWDHARRPAMQGRHRGVGDRFTHLGRPDRLAVLAYVLLDGFDLGIGILFAVERATDRDVMVNTVAPYGTATRPGWCWAAAGYSRCSRSPTPPSCRRLYPLIMRCCWHWCSAASAFEFRFRAAPDGAAMVGPRLLTAAPSSPPSARVSRWAACCRASRCVDRAYAGGWWDWLTPFTVLCGVPCWPATRCWARAG